MMHVLRVLPTAGVLLAASPAAAWAQEGEPGLFSINLGLSIWTVVVFLLLVLLLGRFAWRPILGTVEAREQRIQQALDDSAARQAEALRLLEEHKRQLADARRQAGEILAEGKAAGERLRREIEEKARSEGHAIVESARREIGREKDRALDELRKEAVELALAAAAKLLHERLDADADRALVLNYLDGLGSDAPEAQA
jgi:F-type H+-transporting ATPase subunit b